MGCLDLYAAIEHALAFDRVKGRERLVEEPWLDPYHETGECFACDAESRGRIAVPGVPHDAVGNRCDPIAGEGQQRRPPLLTRHERPVDEDGGDGTGHDPILASSVPNARRQLSWCRRRAGALVIRHDAWVVDEGWDFNDALLLTALGSARDGRDLSGLISAADAFNHDVLPADEAAKAVGRLIASRLVERVGNRFRLTREGASIYESRRGGMFEQAPSVLIALRQVSLVDGQPGFTAADYNDAYEKYRRRRESR